MLLFSRSADSFVIPWTAPHQALLCMGFSRQEYWSGLLFPTLGDLPHSGIQLASPVLQADSLVLSHRGSSANILICPQLINRFNEIPMNIPADFCVCIRADSKTNREVFLGRQASACQCRGHGFDPRSRKIPHAEEQLSP